MKKLVIALAIILGINLVSSMVGTMAKISYAQESPNPEPEPPDKD